MIDRAKRHPVLSLLLGLFGLLVALYAVFGFMAWRGGSALEGALDEALSDLEESRWDEAASSIDALVAESERFSSTLRGPLPRVVSLIPLAGRSVGATRALTESAAIAAAAARQAVPILDAQSFWVEGRINLDALRELRAAAKQAAPELERALDAVESSPGWPLPGPLGGARRDALDRLRGAADGLDVAVKAVDLSESVLGASGQRRYFIAFENPSEMRGAGGLWGNYGILVAEDARLKLGRFGRMQEDLGRFARAPGPDWYGTRYARFEVARDWRQMPSGPDFPTVASIAEHNLRDAPDIGPVDGTIAIDPLALSALLRITGPVEVASWPEPITADNVVRVTMHDAYSSFEGNDQRVGFLSEAALAVWSRLVEGDINLGAVASSGLGGAVEGKHLRLHFARPQEQELAVALGAAGEIGDPNRTIALVTQNTAGNKMDYWLERSLDVVVDLKPDGDASVRAIVTLRNGGPDSGEPRYVIGPHDDRFEPGMNVQLIRLYVPGSSAIRGRRTDRPLIAEEQGFVVAEWDVRIPAGETVRRVLNFDVEGAWDPDGRDFRLNLRKQAFPAPDDIHVSVRPPWGRRVYLDEAECSGGKVVADVALAGPVKKTLWGWVVGPWARAANCG